MPKKPLTHIARAERRKKMADEVKAGKSLAQVARKYGVMESTVRLAVRIHGVQMKKIVADCNTSTLEILGRLLAGERQSAIASDVGCSRENVNDIAKRAGKAGIHITKPKRKAKSACN